MAGGNHHKGRRDHWRKVHGSKAPDEVSWHQDNPTLSLRMIAAAGLPPEAAIIDIGGGASRLVDGLLDQGYNDISVLDIAPEALATSQARLGERSAKVNWLALNVLDWQPEHKFALWHDRAAFHFLVEEEERRLYRQRLQQALEPGGNLIIATFALDGPEKCSGLPVRRYDPQSLASGLGPGFTLVESEQETHLTPAGGKQSFVFCRFVKS